MDRNTPHPPRFPVHPPPSGSPPPESWEGFLALHAPFFQGFPQAMILVGPPEGRILFANREALTLLSATEEDLRGRLPQEWGTGTTLEGEPCVPEEDLGRLCLQQEVGPLCFALTPPSGPTVALSLRGAPLKGPGGLVLCGMLLLTDITPRWRNERALAESERRHRELSTLLRSMCDNVPDLIWAKDMEKRFLFTNRAMTEKLLNARDTEEPLGMTDLFFARREREAHPEDPRWHTFGEICRDSDILTLEAMAPSRFDEWGNVKGRFLYLDVHKAPFYDHRGNLVGTVGCGRDVTRERHMEEVLAESEERMKLALEGGEILAWDWDLLSGKIHLTPPPEDLPPSPEGYPLEILMERIHPEDLPTVLRGFREIQSTFQDGRFEHIYRRRHPEGRWAWIWSRGSVSRRDRNGRPLRVTGVARDVTERMEMQHAMKRSETRYRTLFDNALDAFLVVDEDTALVREANREAERLLGYLQQGMRGTRLRLLPCATGPEGPLDLRDLLNPASQPPPRELFALTREGRPVPVQASGKRMDLPEGEQALLVILRDLTPTLRLRGELLQSQKMRALGTLAEGMGHELNNLLGPLQGYAEMGLGGHRDPSFCFSRILEGTKRARDLVRKLLLTSRAPGDLRPRSDWRRFLEDHVAFLEEGLPQEVRVEVDLQPGSFPLAADPDHLRQILLHLWSNALWATGDRGVIRIRLQRLDLDGAQAALHPGLLPGPHGVLSVEDEGCGMEEDVRSRAFEPFFSTRSPQGAGLGLSVVHGLAIHYRGAVEVESQPQRGTRVRLLLPLATADTPPEEGGDAL